MRREELRTWLRLGDPPPTIQYAVDDVRKGTLFHRQRISYASSEGDPIAAYLLVPNRSSGRAPAVVVHHQHNSERHLGKSEVCGLAGNPLQAFGVALAEAGFVVLAPDSICFEDRRAGRSGIEPHPDDWLQHYNEMSHRLVRGDTLMRKVLDDAQRAISVLAGREDVDASRIGILGHSYGGNTVLFQAAIDERVAFACSSGAACSYRAKLEHRTGIEMAEVLPGAIGLFDIVDLVELTAPRPMLLVSATDDVYSRDADEIVSRARSKYIECGAAERLQHLRYDGGHEMTAPRHQAIIAWFKALAARSSQPASSATMRRTPLPTS